MLVIKVSSQDSKAHMWITIIIYYMLVPKVRVKWNTEVTTGEATNFGHDGTHTKEEKSPPQTSSGSPSAMMTSYVLTRMVSQNSMGETGAMRGSIQHQEESIHWNMMAPFSAWMM